MPVSPSRQVVRSITLWAGTTLACLGSMPHQDHQPRKRAEWLQLAPLQVALVLALVFGITGKGQAHGGGLDKHGCHNDRKNGGYHCHRAPTAQPVALRQNIASSHGAPTSAPPTRRGTGGVYYANCAEARAAGVAPIRRGQPGYAPHLDRDNDGIACEPYRGR